MVKIVNEMPLKVQRRFKALKVLSDQQSKLHEVFDKISKDLQNKINEKKKPIYEERKRIVAGEQTDFGERPEKFNKLFEELKKAEEQQASKAPKTEEEEDEEDWDEVADTDVEHLKDKQGIPDLWYKAIQNGNEIGGMIQSVDHDILKHLIHAECSKTEKPYSMTATLYFSENDYFEDSSLSLKGNFREDGQRVETFEGTKIQWKEGKDITKKKIKKKQKIKNLNMGKTVEKSTDVESFFALFDPTTVPSWDSN